MFLYLYRTFIKSVNVFLKYKDLLHIKKRERESEGKYNECILKKNRGGERFLLQHEWTLQCRTLLRTRGSATIVVGANTL